MTREEAISLLKQYIDYNNPRIPDFYTMAEACEVVIKALEQQPMDIVTDMDCVSRQLVLKQTYNWSKDEFLRVTNPFDYLRKRINSLPSVTPQFCEDCISREETLKTLMDEWTEYDSELIDYLFEKIDKLPSVSPQPCEDAISRQVVLEAIDDDNRNGHYSCFATNNDAECFKQIIRELPSVTAQPKIGYWEWLQYDGNPKIGNWHCSECRTIVPRIPEVDNTPIYKWCPMCGCKMQEVENGTNN